MKTPIHLLVSYTPLVSEVELHVCVHHYYDVMPCISPNRNCLLARTLI